jgi:hypothetical protein
VKKIEVGCPTAVHERCVAQRTLARRRSTACMRARSEGQRYY